MTHPRPKSLLAVALPLVFWSLGAHAAPFVFVDSPAHGSFHIGSTVDVTGHVASPGDYVSITVNGIGVPVASTYQVTVPVDTSVGLNRIVAQGTLATGEVTTHAVMIVAGDGVNTGFVLDGELSPDSLALSVSNTGLEQIAPIVESLSGDALDISTLITDQNPIATGSFLGINYVANAVEVGFGGFDLAAVATQTGINTDIQIDDFFLEMDMDLGFLGSCTLEVETATANIGGFYDLGPLASDPSSVDVVLASPVSVVLGGFGSQFVSGVCDDPLIGDIINLIITQGTIQQLMQDGFESNLADPDGAGPLDSPLAAAIEQSLAGISIAGAVGAALNVMIEAPITSVVEDTDGMTIYTDAAVYSTDPDPNAVDLPASFTVAEPQPQFGALTPDQQLPYGLALAMSTSGLNQFMKAQVENGLLHERFTEVLGVPLTMGVVAWLIPGFSCLPAPPNTPMEMVIQPTMSPVVTGDPGPGGELTEMQVGGVGLFIRAVGASLPVLMVSLDFESGLDLNFTQAGLEFALSPPTQANSDLYVIINAGCAADTQVVGALQGLLAFMAEDLSNLIDPFPIPSLLGLDLQPVEVSRLGGGFLGLFANLEETPTTKIESVVFTDLSSGDFRQQGGCWLREWRHRLSGQASGSSVSANLKGMLGADAGCTTNDASSTATLSHRINFDVASVPGEQWTIDVDHSILGALDRISDGYNDGGGFQDGGGTAMLGNVTASWSVAGGNSGNFDFTPSVTQISDGIGGSSSDEDIEFSGMNGATIVGTGDASVELTFQVDLDTFSNSNFWFPTANGDEMAIRLGKNDTIDNNFSAGGYPGMGSRNIADDGHEVTVELTTTPLP